jgi:hypothetical protein
VSAWQPIETAPKDRPVEVCNAEKSVIAQHMTSFIDGEEAWVYARAWLDETASVVSFQINDATHWREVGPLPEHDAKDVL